jgi:hypothetical protein
MKKNSKKEEVKPEEAKELTFLDVVRLIESKTSCCEVDNGVITCVTTLLKQHQPYNLSISYSEKLFHLSFFLTSDTQEFEELKEEVILFFEQFSISKSNIFKKGCFIKLDIPATMIEQVIIQFDIFYPDLDETKELEQENIEKINDDEEEGDIQYNIVT